MKRLLYAISVSALLLPHQIFAQAERPNIVMIMADDIGFSDFGCYGSEIKTPNIDSLADNGVRFTQFYNMAKCNPTRSTLFSGLYMPRENSENAVAFSSVLRDAGYYTAVSGKEHFDNWVPKRCRADKSFEDSFVFQTCVSYFVPPEKGQYEKAFRLNGKALLPSEIEAEIQPLYKTDFITDYALKFLNKAESQNRPFFLYLPFHAAHYPLQARPEDIAKYCGKYKNGWDEIRAARLDRLKEMKLLDESVELSKAEPALFKTGGKTEYCDWNSLSPEKQDELDLEMAVFAAMIDRLDQNIGRVLAKLDAMKVRENTLILLCVDNGSCPYPWDKTPNVPPGGADSYRSLSPAWAHVGNTPFRQYKRFGHEGGCRSPFIANWRGKIKTGINHSPAHIADLYPTFLELAGAEYPTEIDKKPTPKLDGTSMVSLLKSGEREQPKVFISAFRNFNPMLRMGDWKIVREGKKPWELYNVKNDPAEKNNLAETHPEKLQTLEKEWSNYESAMNEKSK